MSLRTVEAKYYWSHIVGGETSRLYLDVAKLVPKGAFRAMECRHSIHHIFIAIWITPERIRERLHCSSGTTTALSCSNNSGY
jgi:hypothetical protein